LRASAEALPKIAETLDADISDQAELARLTRRALSQMGNLPKLAASPLTRLPVVEQRLARANGGDNTLERAAALKFLLTEAILRLKPTNGDDFGVTDEWRHYNALYFPYVIGLKPYSRRADYTDLDNVGRQALEWFHLQVPERTLYHWQNAAAQLVAQYLQEMRE
jgi:hypothetical protein